MKLNNTEEERERERWEGGRGEARIYMSADQVPTIYCLSTTDWLFTIESREAGSESKLCAF